MPNESSSSRSTLRRHRLADLIASRGFDVMPCSRCLDRGLRCQMAEHHSSKCSECVRAGRPCDGQGVALNSCECGIFLVVSRMLTCTVSRIVSESRRLDSAEESAEQLLLQRRAALRKAQAEMDEALDRLERLRRQKRQLQSKGKEMVQRGLSSLDELEEVERQESEVLSAVHGFQGVDLLSPGFLLDPSLGVDLGSVGLDPLEPSGGTPLPSSS